jgi:hypothetical protein
MKAAKMHANRSQRIGCDTVVGIMQILPRSASIVTMLRSGAMLGKELTVEVMT